MADESETANLVGPKAGGSGRNPLQWAKFGLSEESGSLNQQTAKGEAQELFDEEEKNSGETRKPWWKSNFFITEPVLFGTWDGVFTACMMNIFGVVLFLRTGWMVVRLFICLFVCCVGRSVHSVYDEHLWCGAVSEDWVDGGTFVCLFVCLFVVWDGVFTACMMNIFGVVLFLRTGWMVGNAGIGLSIVIVFMTISMALLPILSAIGVTERCHMEHGGLYFLLSHALGGRVGGSVGFLFVFGQAVVCSLYCTGFGESFAEAVGWNNEWAVRGIAIVTLLVLLGINLAGVKWVIKVQLLLVGCLGISLVDFIIGTFVKTDIASGVVGYSVENFRNNTGPDYIPGQDFFTVFGVFFPTATGVMAGVNMSGDLKTPNRSIPIGSLTAIGVSTILYVLFVLLLGAVCTRDGLQDDFMIAEKVSGVGVLWLLGLYISSLSSCLSGLYGAPRVLQCICNENVIPVIKVLGRGRGPNKEPFLAILVCGFISFSFLFVGQLNLLAPIVTINFMLTYAMVDYAYFAVGMSYDMHLKRKEKYEGNGDKKETESLLSHVIDKGKKLRYAMVDYAYFAVGMSYDMHLKRKEKYEGNGDKKETESLLSHVIDKGKKSLLLHVIDKGKKEGEEKAATNGVGPKYGTLEEPKTGSLIDTSEPKTAEKTVTKEQMADELTSSAIEKEGDKKGEDAEKGKDKTGDKDEKDPPRTFHYEIYKMPSSWYSFLCNRWISLIGAIASLVIMFAIQWAYALANLAVYVLLYVYIGQANPGVYPGLTDFSLIQWIKTTFQSLCRRGPPPPEQYVVTPMFVPTKMETEQLNEDSEDYQGRGRYHQSTVMRGEEYDKFE
ncbi:solute carrier family 12 member 8-like [Branchiostoma floridae]|uniref:Solute carrier family 12 member 8-like n=1 Tax=Branchiostoma floridae TaxID=7739 RepID=A0A9J7HJ72_BRAFL|nr:solute carrier family 12 member 8-like [Branchiostoma floridae]